MERRLPSSNPNNWKPENGEIETLGVFVKRMRELNGWSRDELVNRAHSEEKTDEWLKKVCLELLNLEEQNSTRETFIDLASREIAKEKKNYSKEDRKKMIEDFLDVLPLRLKEPQKKRLISLVTSCKNELQATQYPEETSEKNKKGLSKSRLLSIENERKRKDGTSMIRPKKDTLEFLAKTLQIPMVVMEEKLNEKPKVLIEHYGEQRLTQAREVIEDALMVLEKMKEAKEEKTP